jgi:hypothetical protein
MYGLTKNLDKFQKKKNIQKKRKKIIYLFSVLLIYKQSVVADEEVSHAAAKPLRGKNKASKNIFFAVFKCDYKVWSTPSILFRDY